jgi:hypothetical protein
MSGKSLPYNPPPTKSPTLWYDNTISYLYIDQWSHVQVPQDRLIHSIRFLLYVCRYDKHRYKWYQFYVVCSYLLLSISKVVLNLLLLHPHAFTVVVSYNYKLF